MKDVRNWVGFFVLNFNLLRRMLFTRVGMLITKKYQKCINALKKLENDLKYRKNIDNSSCLIYSLTIISLTVHSV